MMKALFRTFFFLLLFISCESESSVPSVPDEMEMDNGDPNPTSEPVIYDGEMIVFEKANFGNPNDRSAQDRITDLVWITRADQGGLFNRTEESAYQTDISPLGTEWAEGSLDDFRTLIYTDWKTAVVQPPSSVGKQYVVHLIAEDIYLQVEFISWTQGRSSGGGFSYRRSTPSE